LPGPSHRDAVFAGRPVFKPGKAWAKAVLDFHAIILYNDICFIFRKRMEKR